ncbi:MAG: hypothetical protein NTV70_26060 [Acidobacteria bacterium]|nr:hypothetical protein [Acidobacteriota bacterium]
MALPTDWKEFLQSLNSNSVDYTLVGAFSVMYHAIPRTTSDIDILVRPTLENGARVVAALRNFGFGSSGLTAEDFVVPGQFLQLGYVPNRIDLLTAISGVTIEEIWAGRVLADLEGIPVWILGKDELIRNKRSVDRLKDRTDLEILERPTGGSEKPPGRRLE